MGMPEGKKIDFPLPPNLPVPSDDGAANHLEGIALPPVSLASTAGMLVDVSRLGHKGRVVIFCYPMTGVPGQPLPEGWDMIPGARGCTPQTCGFRDLYKEFQGLKVEVFGCSTQTTEYQKEMADRLHVPFQILSDADFKLTDAIHLPTFDVDGKRLLRRLTMVIGADRIEHVFYPVFPPNESADEVMRWVRAHPAAE